MASDFKSDRLGAGYTLPPDLGIIRAMLRQPRLAGGAVVTEHGTLASDNFVPGSTGWSIDGDGNVEFNAGVFRGAITTGAVITGSVVINSPGDIHSANYVANTSGWIVRYDGTAEFNSITARGNITADSFTTSGGNDRVQIGANDAGAPLSSVLYYAGGAIRGHIYGSTNSGGAIVMGRGPTPGSAGEAFILSANAATIVVGTGGTVSIDNTPSVLGASSLPAVAGTNWPQGDALKMLTGSTSVTFSAGNATFTYGQTFNGVMGVFVTNASAAVNPNVILSTSSHTQSQCQMNAYAGAAFTGTLTVSYLILAW